MQFRAYASIGLNLIPQKKRSDLQLSGCHLVDCPHNGRKEVADKMIIVDAMQFAYEHLEKGADIRERLVLSAEDKEKWVLEGEEELLSIVNAADDWYEEVRISYHIMVRFIDQVAPKSDDRSVAPLC